MTKEKLLLLDGNSLAYRAFFALPLLTNDQGIHTNAIYGFTTMLQKILAEENPTRVLVAFDAGKTTFRHSTYKEYKGGRQKTPPELSEQFPYLRKLLDAYNMQRYELEMYEADDIIGTLAREADEAGLETVVVSGDKDLTQLASDNTTVYITRKGMTDIEHYTPAHILEKYTLTPLQIIDMKGLMGDKSDNIPGVPSVGEKTAIKLLTQFETVEGVYEHIDEVKGKLKEKLVENEAQAKLSKELATINRQAPIDVTIDQLAWEGPNTEQLFALWHELSFKSLIEKSDLEVETTEQQDIPWQHVETLSTELVSGMGVHVELDDAHYHTCDILGIGFSDGKASYYMTFDDVLKSEAVKAYLADDTLEKYVFDVKAQKAALRRFDIELNGVTEDVMLAAYIDEANQNVDEIAQVAKTYGYHDVQVAEQVYGKGAKRAIPAVDVVAEHVCRKALAVWKIMPKLAETLQEKEQFELYKTIELPLALILCDMECAGVAVDEQRLVEMGQELTSKLAAIEQKIYALAGTQFNINSPKQLGVVLFEKLGLPIIKKTKTGYSTAADVLEKLQPEHEVIDYILEYRQLGKLNSTYIEGLLKVVHEKDHKIHTRYQQALTATGRLSSVDPNLQNIPIRLEEGRKIRQAFVPSHEGWTLFSADYSQIELRVLADMADEQNLIDAFKHDLDIHTKTAMDVFGVEKEDVTPNMRRQAKAVNFGIVYGISDYGLSQNLGITRKEAAEFIERYFESYPGVKGYMESVVAQAKKDGYVTTLLNRRRYLPDLNSRNFNIRSFAERTAMNTPIQGTAADIIKKAMIDMAAALKAHNLQSTMLLQVHDELIFEAPPEEVDILAKLVPEVMEHAVALKVPLKADAASGATWYDAK